MTTTTTDEQEKVKAFTDGLRDLADFLDRFPVLIEPNFGGARLYRWVRETDDDPADTFKGLASLLDNPEATEDGKYFNATQRFGPHQLQVTVPITTLIPDYSKPVHPLLEDKT